MSNAVLHAYRGGLSGIVRVAARPGQGDVTLVVDVEDNGVGMAPRVDSPGMGLGLPLIASTATGLDVQSNGHGTCIRFWFGRIEPDDSATLS